MNNINCLNKNKFIIKEMQARGERPSQFFDFGKFVIIPADQVAANRSKAYNYIF